MRLIVTEKDNSAKKISQILSGGKAKQDKSYGIPHYSWEGEDGGHRDRPQRPPDEPRLPGGLLGLAQGRAARADLRAAVKEPVQKSVHKALRKQAKDADSVVIATDYDREGELIGLEALEEILDANPKLRNGSDGSRAAGRQARPVLRAHQGGDRAMRSPTSSSCPSRWRAPVRRARTST